MQTFRTVTYTSPCPCVVALGCFDGVHIGHRLVIEEAKSIAKRERVPLTVFTFEQPPRNFFFPNSVPLITQTFEKELLLEQLGVDICVSVPPEKQIFSMTAEEFVEKILVDRLRATNVVCGFNYTFGAGGKANAQDLVRLCTNHGVCVRVMPEKTVDGLTVSSSAIREAAQVGDMVKVSQLLGRPYSLSADVVNGQHLARKLGFPTINIVPNKNSLLVKNGVYATRIRFDGNVYFGITNIGVRPTVNTDILCAETHIFDFDGDIYGKHVTVEFIKFIRSEKKFDTIEDMSLQVNKDIEKVKSFFKEY